MLYTTHGLVLFVVSTVVNVAPNPLNAPKCCEKKLIQVDVQITENIMIGGQAKALFLDGHWWFDSLNKTNIFEGKMSINNGQEKQLKFIQTSAKKQYNILDGACRVIPQVYPTIGDGCVPENATLKGQEVLGSDFTVNTWNAQLKSDKYDFAFEATITPDCVPVTTTIIGEVDDPVLGKMALTTTMRFSSFQEGIEDLSVFDIPDNCPK